MPSTWKASLNLLLQQLINEVGQSARIAIIGVGNRLRSDDAAGMLVARELSQHKLAIGDTHLLICEGGQAPENRTGELRAFAPHVVILIDAADMGQNPGTIQWISEEQIDGMSASTHSLPLSILARYLTLELKCTVAFLGIQPLSNEVGETVSPEIRQAVSEVLEGLKESLQIFEK